jgi:hypothetical protein
MKFSTTEYAPIGADSGFIRVGTDPLRRERLLRVMRLHTARRNDEREKPRLRPWPTIPTKWRSRRPGQFLDVQFGWADGVPDAAWELVDTNPALLLHVDHALEARWWETTDGDFAAYLPLSIERLMDDLRIPRQPGRKSHDARQREPVVNAVAFWAGMEIDGIWTPKRTVEKRRLLGKVWEWVEGRCRCEYRPGVSLQDREWRRYNPHEGLIPASILTVSGKKNDTWTNFVGTYLAMMAPVNSYRSYRVGVETLRSGLGLTIDDRHEGRFREKLTASLDRLIESGLLFTWKYRDVVTPEDEEMLDVVFSLKLREAADASATPTHLQEAAWKCDLTPA